jgi:hypothetical protein
MSTFQFEGGGGADMQKLELKMSLPNFLFLLFSELTSLKDK